MKSIEDHRREQPRWKFEEQWDHREGDSIGARDDQDDPKRYRGKVMREDEHDAHCVAVDRRSGWILLDEV